MIFSIATAYVSSSRMTGHFIRLRAVVEEELPGFAGEPPSSGSDAREGQESWRGVTGGERHGGYRIMAYMLGHSGIESELTLHSHSISLVW